MIDLYIYDGNLECVGIVDGFSSVIWAKRYNDVGDCEVYVPATEQNVELFQMGRYIVRADDDMVCRINGLEISTSAENGDYITVTGIDTKSFLDQRIVWGKMTCNGNAETFVRDLVDKSLINPTVPVANFTRRKLVKPNNVSLFELATASGFTKKMTQNISYKNVGEKVREICKRFGWGYRVFMDDGYLKFGVYKGTDRSKSIIFSAVFDNLIESNYSRDASEQMNVALVGGKGQGDERELSQSGAGEGVDRYEMFLDEKDMSQQVKLSDLKLQYPSYSTSIDPTRDYPWWYLVTDLKIPIYNDEQLGELRVVHPGGTEGTDPDGTEYYQIPGNTLIAYSKNVAPTDSDEVNITTIIYQQYLASAGYEALAEYNITEAFEAKVEPFSTFKYNEDFFLGDIVTVQNGYGVTKSARIIEVIESEDENGYVVEPTVNLNPED